MTGTGNNTVNIESKASRYCGYLLTYFTGSDSDVYHKDYLKEWKKRS